MADIFNATDGGTGGNQVQGTIRIGYPGDPTITGRNGETYNPIDIDTSTVVSINTKYDASYTGIRKYTGDTDE